MIGIGPYSKAGELVSASDSCVEMISETPRASKKFKTIRAPLRIFGLHHVGLLKGDESFWEEFVSLARQGVYREPDH